MSTWSCTALRQRHKRTHANTRGAFTLIEVLVALSLSAMVVLAARMLVDTLAASASRINERAREIDEEANGERLLRALVGSIEVGREAVDLFGGDEQRASFRSWCQTPRGWQERCQLELEVRQLDSGWALVAFWPDARAIQLLRSRHSIELRYLVDARNGGTWFARWGSGPIAPRAIGVLVDGDTLILRIGERA